MLVGCIHKDGVKKNNNIEMSFKENLVLEELNI